MSVFRLLRAVTIRIANTFRRSRVDGDFREEFESNLQLHIDAAIGSGMTPEEARRLALLQFGGIDVAYEAWRDEKRLPFLEVLMRDATYAVRMMRKSPGFALAVILVLAISIGGNVAIFSIVNAALIHPLPFEKPGRLVVLWGNVQRVVVERRGASIPDYIDWRDSSKSFEGLAAYWNASFTLHASDERRLVSGEVVGAKYFSLLGVKPILGREFQTEEETRPASAPVVILSHAFWKDQLGSNPDVLGTTLELDSRLHTVVGVMPAGFAGLTDQALLFIPPGSLSGAQDLFSNRGGRWFAALGRLRDGVTREQAQVEMNAISLALQKTYPATNDKRAVEVASLINETFGEVRPALLALLGAVGMVLLIACANVANLLLVRTETRHSEIAVRTALGAGRRDLLQLLMTESLVLSGAGMILGILLAGWGVNLILSASPIQLPSFVNVRIDRDVILFAVALAVITGTFMGISSSLQIGQSSLGETLKGGSAKMTGSAVRQRLRGGLVVAEIGLTVTLLVGAGLFIESFRRVSQVHPGFRTDHLLTLQVTAPPDGRLNRQILHDTLAAIPGVASLGLASDIPFTGSGAIFYTAEGQPPVDATNAPRAYIHRVMPGYFKSLDIVVQHGREFETTEPNTSVIVSESVVKRFWPGQDGIGKRIKGGNTASTNPWLNIVGVVNDTRTRGLPNNPTADPDLYFPYIAEPGTAGVLIRTTVDPSTIATTVRNEIHRVDNAVVVSSLATMDELIRPLTSRSRFTGWLTGVFSVLALVLAMVGVYGTMSYSVSQRSREIGIRIALGATDRQVLRIVLGRALVLITTGLAVGISSGLLVSRGIHGLLFGVSPTEPLIFALAATLVMALGILAAFLPARHALRIDPMRALRAE